MTAIAYRDGVLAADTLIACGDTISGRSVKIGRSSSGVLFGSAGRTDIAEKFRAWASAYDFARWPDGLPNFPDHPKDGRGFTGIVIMPDRRVIEYGPDGLPMAAIDDDFRALGSAMEIAYGAMEAGASAEEAVRICIKRSTTCGGEVTVLRLDGAEPALRHQHVWRGMRLEGVVPISTGVGILSQPRNAYAGMAGSEAA